MKDAATLRVGWGALTYQVDPNWGDLPSSLTLGPVTAVAASSDGRLYVCHRSRPTVLILDAGGLFAGALTADEITDPHGICTDARGNVYIADRDRHVVVVFSPDGNLVREIGTRDSASGETPFNHPTDVAVSNDGMILVADGYGNSRIHAFSADGELLRSWGEPGRGPGQFRVPHGIAVDGNNRVYVPDRENDRVQVFDRDGKLLSVWDGFRGPTDVCIDDQQRIFVSDHVPTVTALDTGGRVLVKIRTYHDTHGICCDAEGNIFIASTAGRCVIKYSPVTA
jgi:DNA-binding beta-propeller fold protein YncE